LLLIFESVSYISPNQPTVTGGGVQQFYYQWIAEDGTTLPPGDGDDRDVNNGWWLPWTTTPKPNARKKVAFVIVFSSDNAAWLLDHSAIYSYSVRKVPSRYQIDLIALLSVNVSANFANHLRAFGFDVQVRRLPVTEDDLQPGFYRTEVV
jgi:hypothetical protein